MDAPRWTTLDPNSKLVFWESREEVAEVLGRVAGEQEQVSCFDLIVLILNFGLTFVDVAVGVH